ncbi:hypothetical protein [Methylobacterium brachiatum]
MYRPLKIGLTPVRAVGTTFRPILAEISYASDDGPARTILHGRLLKWSGLYPSIKARAAQPWEAWEERTRLMCDEVDTNVIQVATQPHQLKIFYRGKKIIYYPDVAERLSNDLIRIVETKKHLREIKDRRDYEIKLEQAGATYAHLGYEFLTIDKAGLEEPAVRFRNVRLLHDLGRLRTTVQQRGDVEEIFGRARSPVVPMGLLAEVLARLIHEGSGSVVASVA